MTLQEISDRMEIQDLMVAYCYAIDRKNWDELDNVFLPKGWRIKERYEEKCYQYNLPPGVPLA